MPQICMVSVLLWIFYVLEIRLNWRRCIRCTLEHFCFVDFTLLLFSLWIPFAVLIPISWIPILQRILPIRPAPWFHWTTDCVAQTSNLVLPQNTRLGHFDHNITFWFCDKPSRHHFNKLSSDSSVNIFFNSLRKPNCKGEQLSYDSPLTQLCW